MQYFNKSRGDQNWRNGQSRPDRRPTSTKNRLSLNKKGVFFSDELKRKLIMIGTSLVGVLLIAFISLVFWISRSLPNPNQLIDREVAQSTQILDRTGKEVLYEVHGDEKRTLVNLSDIPVFAQKATIAIEDKDYYKHGGFSLMAIARTAVTNVLFGKKAGASTLTQQFIKNAVLTNEKTYTRKIKELLLAYRMEKRFSKDEILQMYLNEIPYGSNAYGIQAASQKYFGKNVKDINLAEAAILAAMPQAPSKYSPYGSNLNLLLDRQKYILDLMVDQDYISQEEADSAKQYELNFKRQAENIKAPHFVMYVKELLAEKYGDKMIEQGGLKIYTSLDLFKQQAAEEIIKDLTKDGKEKYGASNAALVSADPKTGQVLAMVGSRDYFDDSIDGQVNIATSKRQPGSSLKPLVYAASFIKGYTPNTILYDVVTNFSTDPAKTYEPRNYTNEEYGPVTMRKALAGSLNTPAVKAIYLAGIDKVTGLANELGYTTLRDKDRFGLSLVLGGGEVMLLEHVNAYGAFAREGIVNEITPILKIEDKDGKILEEYKAKEKKVFEPNIARMINDVLSDNGARSYVFGANNYLTLGKRPVAAKTGTTNDYRDAWTIGYTPSLVSGVWVGNNNNEPMKKGSAGGTVAGRIWHDYMKKILGDTPIEEFKKPEIPKRDKPMLNGAVPTTIYDIDKISGFLATSSTPPELIEKKQFSSPHSILYYVDKNDPLGDAPKNPSADPQFSLWEGAVQKWFEKQNATSTVSTSTPPTKTDDVHIPENLPTLSVANLEKNQTVTDPSFNITIETTAKRGVKTVEYYINDNLLFTSDTAPFSLAKDISFLDNGFQTLKVRACDDVLNCTSESVEFNLLLNGNVKKSAPEIIITAPTDGLTATTTDFPLKVIASIKNAQQLASVKIYLTNKKDDKQILIKSIAKISSDIIEENWSKPTASGTYLLSIKGMTWSKEKINSDEITITIQ